MLHHGSGQPFPFLPGIPERGVVKMNKLELRPALAQPSAVVPPSHSARRTFVRPDHLALGAIATRGWMFRPHPYLRPAPSCCASSSPSSSSPAGCRRGCAEHGHRYSTTTDRRLPATRPTTRSLFLSYSTISLRAKLVKSAASRSVSARHLPFETRWHAAGVCCLHALAWLGADTGLLLKT